MLRFLALFAIFAVVAPLSARAGPLQDAETAYAQNKLAEARKGFQSIWRDQAAAAQDRAAAARELARIAWLIDGDATAAEALLREAYDVNVDVCETAALKARVQHESGRPREAAASARAAQAQCDQPARTDALRLMEARSWLDIAAAAPAERAEALTAAQAALATLSPAQAVTPEASRNALAHALLRGDAAATHAAWRAYLQWGESTAPPGLAPDVAQAGKLIVSGLRTQARASEHCALIMLLIRVGLNEEARLFDKAMLTAKDRAATEYAPVRIYYTMRDKIERAALVHNRATARGHHDKRTFRRAVKEAFGDAVRAMGRSRSDVRKVLREIWGLHYKLGLTGNYMSLHAGHVVADERRTIEQFGRRGQVHLVTIDGLISNGFQSWLWDGRAAAGGWAESKTETITRVRPAYTRIALRALDRVIGRPGRTEVEERIAKLEADDRAALAAAPVVYLPGLAARLNLQVVDAISAAARKATKGPQAFDQTFLRLFNEALIDRAIFIHEGRHMLDGTRGQLSGAELEFRAKLSELQLAEYPKAAFSGINDHLVGTKGPHGVANTRIMDGYRGWIEARGREIAGYEPAKPGLMQLHRLSDAQIRAVARGLDPGATERP